MGEFDDNVTLIELGEAEDDAASVAEGEAPLSKLDAEAEQRGVEALLSGEADGMNTYRRSPRRRGRHRKPGLGVDAVAHVHALGASGAASR